MEEVLNFYEGKLKLKKRRIVEYIDEKNSVDGFKSSKREMEYYVLKAEVELLTHFVADLKGI
jgi:hypothetical protein